MLLQKISAKYPDEEAARQLGAVSENILSEFFGEIKSDLRDFGMQSCDESRSRLKRKFSGLPSYSLLGSLR